LHIFVYRFVIPLYRIVFNPGSGLGYPDLAKLAGDFG
jgi:hypothetical protein